MLWIADQIETRVLELLGESGTGLDPGLPGQLAEPGALFFVVQTFGVLHCVLRKASLNPHFISLDDSKLTVRGLDRQWLNLGNAEPPHRT